MERQIALVTGAGRGIGRAIAIELARANVDVAIHYNGSLEKAEETQRLCKEFNVRTVLVRADVSQKQECKELVDQVVEEMGGLDILVNNAGITKDGLFLRMKEEDYDEVMDTNLKGAFFVTKYASSIMIKQRYGRIVNISSISGVGGNVGQANYAASKAGLIGLTKSLAKELGKKGILVNAIAPGFVRTDMTDKLSDKVKEAIVNQTAVGYIAEPEDIANAVSFLASKQNRYITGEVLRIDGGMSI